MRSLSPGSLFFDYSHHQPVGSLAGRTEFARGDRYVATGSGQNRCGIEAKVAGATGHDRGLAFQIEQVCYFGVHSDKGDDVLSITRIIAATYQSRGDIL